MKSILKFALVGASILGASALPARAGTVTIGPFQGGDCTFLCTNTYQQVYASSAFSGSGPIDITRVSFIVDFTSGLLPLGVWQMSLSTSANPVGSLSSNFASNVGANNAVFDIETFSGSVGSLLSFNGNYVYDPASGPLLVTIRLISGTNDNSTRNVAVQSGTDNGVYNRAYAFNSFTTADGVNEGGYGDVTQFTFGAAAVPGPIAGAGLPGLIMAGGGLLGWLVRRRGQIAV